MFRDCYQFFPEIYLFGALFISRFGTSSQGASAPLICLFFPRFHSAQFAVDYGHNVAVTFIY